MAQINKPNEYFNTVTWTGDGVNGRTITTGHDTNFIWGKERSNANSHWLIDIIRGAGQRLRSDTTNAEDSLGSYPSFVTNGFTVPSTLSLNGLGRTFVGWSWLAGGTASSNTDGSITSTVSANTISGFSIVSYTGTGATGTVGHGLNSAPQITIIKRRNAATDWAVYTNAIDGSNDVLFLNTTAAQSATSAFSTDSDTLNFTGSSTVANTTGADAIAYCFHSVKGFSKFGSYTGNGSADGTFVYTGFKPAYFMIKRTDSTGSWIIHDNKRSFYNVTSHDLYANLSDAEVSGNRFDFVSNGVKLRNNPANMNASGGTYIYMAFAENPIVGTNNIPATAR